MTQINPSWQPVANWKLLSVEEIAQDIVENKLDNYSVNLRFWEYEDNGNVIMAQRVKDAAQLAVILGDML